VSPRERTGYWREVINSYQCRFSYDIARARPEIDHRVGSRDPWPWHLTSPLDWEA
jgi:hypothetical protein